MKQYWIIITLLLLASCKQTPPQINDTIINETKIATPIQQPLLSLSEVLDEFAVLDADLNTSWKEEKIPSNIIASNAIEPWTKRLKLIEDLTEKDSLAHKLVQARIEMLHSQAAYYLGAEIGEKGAIPLKQENKTVTAGKVECNNVQEIEKATKLYYTSYNHYMKFFDLMDNILQNSKEAREKIGIDQTRIKFYESYFAQAQKKIDATKNAVEEQCNYVITLEDKN